MRKVLLLSCNTGQGHNSCAQAVREYLEKQGISCETQDGLAFISKQVSEFMSWGHCFMYRHTPGLFRWGYRYSEKHPTVFEEDSGIYKMLTSGVERMYQYMQEGQFDTVVCTHPFSALILTRLLKQHPMRIRTAFIATDYTCYPLMESCDLQHYFIPDECLADEFEKCGIPKERIIAAGIPVGSQMPDKTEKEEAKRQLNIGAKNKHLLIMSGSMGCGPISEIVKYIAEELPEEMEASVICGTNGRLRKKLERKYKNDGKIHIVGYTGQVSLYMDSADLLLTKPGGVSVTEAAVKNLPMAFVDAVAGCERYNMDFFVKLGGAVTADSVKELAEQSIHILESDKERQGMEDALWNCRFSDSMDIIFDELSKENCA